MEYGDGNIHNRLRLSSMLQQQACHNTDPLPVLTIKKKHDRQLTLEKKFLQVTGCVFDITECPLREQEPLLTLPRPGAVFLDKLCHELA